MVYPHVWIFGSGFFLFKFVSIALSYGANVCLSPPAPILTIEDWLALALWGSV